MQITLWQLNESYQALTRLASQVLPKEQQKVAYKLKRITKTAKAAQDELSEQITDLMAKCGFVQGERDVDPKTIDDFNRQSKKFMCESHCEIWGDPFKAEEILPHVSVSPLDLANLDWLILDEEEPAEAKAANA